MTIKYHSPHSTNNLELLCFTINIHTSDTFDFQMWQILSLRQRQHSGSIRFNKYLTHGRLFKGLKLSFRHASHCTKMMTLNDVSLMSELESETLSTMDLHTSVKPSTLHMCCYSIPRLKHAQKEIKQVFFRSIN